MGAKYVSPVIAQLLACCTWLVCLTACKDPFAPRVDPVTIQTDASGTLEDCPASPEWLPKTPDVDMFRPLPHPATECPFYRGGWQNFLIAMQPTDAQGRPALFSFPTIETVFTPYVPYSPTRSYLGDVKQAGRREIVIDRNGYSLYYGIHVNQAFADFIHANHLETPKAIQRYPSDATLSKLYFPADIVEYKSAWQVVDTNNPPADLADYIVVQTTVPTMHAVQDTMNVQHIVEDRDTPRSVTVRLLAIHIVYTLPGHPEFVWASFEHTMAEPGDAGVADFMRNVAPSLVGQNPKQSDPYNKNNSTVVSMDPDYILYHSGVAARDANVSIPESSLHLDEAAQRFVDTDGNPQQTSIYRMFPASKSNTIDPDDAITSLNLNVGALFAMAARDGTLDPADKRGHYRLVGAQWMDKPAYFKINTPLQNDPSSPFAQEPNSPTDVAKVGIGAIKFASAIETDGSDSPYSILAGEDRMSSTAMESFTQPPGAFNNCFTCHNTQATTASGIPLDSDKGGIKLLDPGLLNVSHVLSQFLLEQCNKPENLVSNPDGSKTAVCP